MLYTRALVDFLLLLLYALYNKDTIRYINAALYRIDKTKFAFIPSLENFNFLKIYRITHYIASIAEIGSLLGTDTNPPKYKYVK